MKMFAIKRKDGLFYNGGRYSGGVHHIKGSSPDDEGGVQVVLLTAEAAGETLQKLKTQGDVCMPVEVKL